MIRQALILAAGMGTRLREEGTVATVDPFIETISKQLTRSDCAACAVFAVSTVLLDELDAVSHECERILSGKAAASVSFTSIPKQRDILSLD